jgi:hypothetical protein
MQRAQELGEAPGIAVSCCRSLASQLAVAIQAPESGDELAAKDLAQNGEGNEEARLGCDPVPAIWRQSTCGNNAGDMGMKTPTPAVP